MSAHTNPESSDRLQAELTEFLQTEILNNTLDREIDPLAFQFFVLLFVEHVEIGAFFGEAFLLFIEFFQDTQ